MEYYNQSQASSDAAAILPKKRKFSTGSDNRQPTQVIQFAPPASQEAAAVEGSWHRPQGPCSTGQNTRIVDLQKWQGTPVLAKHDNVYIPAVIYTAVGSDVFVQFDTGAFDRFIDVYGASKFSIINDVAPPLIEQIPAGTRVCVRVGQENKNRVFIEAVIAGVMRDPSKFVVRMTAEELIVKRSDIRLMLPPWWNELVEVPVRSMTGGMMQVHMGTDDLRRRAFEDAAMRTAQYQQQGK